jgi:hypothetical protein
MERDGRRQGRIVWRKMEGGRKREGRRRRKQGREGTGEGW